MVTTVTPATAAVAMHGLTTGSLTLIVVLTLLALLVQKEVIGAAAGERARRLGRILTVAIIPLGMIFLASLVLQVLAVVR